MTSKDERESAGESVARNWTIRSMRHDDIDKCLFIWSQVELTEARQTVSSSLAADPDGFYVAELEETGEIVGMCAGPLNRADTAFMGFYAVLPNYQGLGIGRELWARTVGRLDSSINVGLYGVPSMSDKYKKSGFIHEDAIRMLIYESNPVRPPNLKQLMDIDDLATTNYRLEVIDGETSEKMFRKLIDYDHSVQRFNREKLLRLYLRGDDIPLTLALVRDNNNATIEGLQQHHGHVSERKSSCCAKPSQEAIIEDEALSTTTKSSLSISSSNIPGELPVKPASPIDIPSPVNQGCDCDFLGYGCIRRDNNAGVMVGPIYADSSDKCEVLLRNLIERIGDFGPSNKVSVMALNSNQRACEILTNIGLTEVDQCSRMFTRFVPTASLSKVYYIHSPNFTLF